MKTYRANSDESEAVKDFAQKNELKEAEKQAVIYGYYLCDLGAEKSKESVFKLYMQNINVARKFIAFGKKENLSVSCGTYIASEIAKLVKFIKENMPETTATKQNTSNTSEVAAEKKDEKTKK